MTEKYVKFFYFAIIINLISAVVNLVVYAFLGHWWINLMCVFVGSIAALVVYLIRQKYLSALDRLRGYQ